MPKINTANLVYLMICVIGIAAFFLVGIYPNMRAMAELEVDITALNRQVQSQELLYPIYRQLIKEVQQPVTTSLVLPASESLSQTDLNRINELFSSAAERCRMGFVSAVPDARTYLEDTGHLIIHVTFKGDFFHMRELLLELCALPYLETIEQVRIDAEATEKTIALKLRLKQS